MKFLIFSILFSCFSALAIAFCPPGCECDDQKLAVACDFPGLTSIPILLNPMIKSLVIKNSRALKLEAFSIALYQELTLLELENNHISTIPTDFFQQLPNLERLSLHGNLLKAVDRKTFQKLKNLKTLDLSANQIDRIEPDTFRSLANLQFLNLSSNQLHILPNGTFTGLQNLTVLDLGRNRFSKVPASELFGEMENLRELLLAGNILSELSSNGFLSLQKLEKLDVSSNLITCIDRDAFAGLQELRHLDLARNLLSTPQTREDDQQLNFSKLPEKLEHLGLSGNAWTEFPENTFKNGPSPLKKLLLEDMSQLREIKANAFAGLPNLEHFSVANSHFLSQIHPKAFGSKQSKLRHLDLSNCQLSTLAPEMLHDWMALDTLKLEGNRWNCDCALLSFLPAVLLNLQKRGKLMHNDVVCMLPDDARDERILAMAEKKFEQHAECTATTMMGASSTFLAQEHFLWLASAAALLMLTSLSLLVFCLCARLGKSTRNLNCLCCAKQRQTGPAKRDQCRVQLYATGSSFTESLIYEKGPRHSASDSTASSAGSAGIERLHPTLHTLSLQNQQKQQKVPFSVNDQNIAIATMLRQQQKLMVKHTPDCEKMNRMCRSPSCTNSSNDGEEYYSSIAHDSIYEEHCHYSPPSSPPPPPPIFSEPPNWPPPNVLLAAAMPCQVAVPPYQLRAQSDQNDRRFRPPSIHAAQYSLGKEM